MSWAEPDIKTLAQARKRRYGRDFMNRNGVPYQEGKCAESVADGLRAPHFYQCKAPNGHGVAGLYCKRHANMYEKRAKQERNMQVESLNRGTRSEDEVDDDIAKKHKLAHRIVKSFKKESGYRELTVECCASCGHMERDYEGHPSCNLMVAAMRGKEAEFDIADVDELGFCVKYVSREELKKIEELRAKERMKNADTQR